MQKATKVALGGMISALAVLLMFATGLFPFATYALPAMAGALLIAIVAEFGVKWAYVVFIGISLLSFFIAPDKEAAFLFIAFFGHYPITKSLLERLPNRGLEYIIKFVIFNICIVGCFLILIYLFGMNELLEEFGDFGKYGAWIMLVIGNLIFIVYDIALSRVITAYIHWFRPKFLRKI